MASKVWATVSDQLARKLEVRATEEGRSKSDLISYLLETTMSAWESGEPISEAVKDLRLAIKNEDPTGALAALEIIEKGLND